MIEKYLQPTFFVTNPLLPTDEPKLTVTNMALNAMGANVRFDNADGREHRVFHARFFFSETFTCPILGPLVPLSPPGFKARVGIPLFAFAEANVIKFPEIHLWCYTCRPLDGWHRSRSLPHVHQQRFVLDMPFMLN